MKKILLISLLLLFGINAIYADQLAYISKEDAHKAAKLLKGKTAILFCGCCDDDVPVKIKILKTEVRFTNYENYYEVYVTYKDKKGIEQTIPVDLAYIWLKVKKATKTVGQVLNMEHDPCSEAIKW